MLRPGSLRVSPNSLEALGEDSMVNSQSLPTMHGSLQSYAARPSNTREKDVGPQFGDEILIHQAANNLAARPISEYAISQGNPYFTLRWV